MIGLFGFLSCLCLAKASDRQPELPGLQLLCSTYNVATGSPTPVLKTILTEDSVSKHEGRDYYPDEVVAIDEKPEDKSEVVQFSSDEDFRKYRAAEITIKSNVPVSAAVLSSSIGSNRVSGWSAGRKMFFGFFRKQLYGLKLLIYTEKELQSRLGLLCFFGSDSLGMLQLLRSKTR